MDGREGVYPWYRSGPASGPDVAPIFSGLAGREGGGVEAAVEIDGRENAELVVEALDTLDMLEMVDVDGGRGLPAHDSGEGDQPAGTGDGGLENCDTVEAVELGREGRGCGVVGAGVAIPITALIGCASPCTGPCRVGRIGCCAICMGTKAGVSGRPPYACGEPGRELPAGRPI